MTVGWIVGLKIGAGIQMADRICGAQNPRNTLIICTKHEGHEGRHGKADMPYRSVLWNILILFSSGYVLVCYGDVLVCVMMMYYGLW